LKYDKLVTPEQIEAVLEKLGGPDGVKRFLYEAPAAPELPRRWSEKDGVISFTTVSDGTTGQRWFTRLEASGKRVGPYAKSVLLSKDFVSTTGVTTLVRVLKGELWSDNERITRNIRAEADRRKFIKPNAEVACLIRDLFSNADIKTMGLTWIVAMHDPIEDSVGLPRLLTADRNDDDYSLDACLDHPGDGWRRVSGFAFALPQVP
jgi:hypothetical protein